MLMKSRKIFIIEFTVGCVKQKTKLSFMKVNTNSIQYNIIQYIQFNTIGTINTCIHCIPIIQVHR